VASTLIAPRIDGVRHKVRTSRRSASVDGFSIADTAVEPHNRTGLEKLCR